MAEEDYTGKLTLIEVAAEETTIDGDRPRPGLFHSHPWNVAPPKPEAPVPDVVPRYRLTVQHDSEIRDGSDQLCSVRAESDSRESLLELNAQFEAINYHFVKLELIDETQPAG